MLKNALLIPLAFLFSFFISCKQEVSETVNIDTSEKDSVLIDDQNIQQPEWAKNAVIYEVNIRQFSEDGNFDGVTKDLERLKDMGIDILWLMPIHPIGEKNRKGELGSYYAVKDYKGINPEYGTLDDFKALVDKAHSLEMKVIIDWVANHSSPDNVWIKDNLDYYTKDSLGNAPIPTEGTDWWDVADLNYDNMEMREAMQDAMLYWVNETDIDGYRCDMAGMVPLDFWLDTRKKLENIKPVFMVAEGEEPELHQAFNMTYGWPFKNIILEIAESKKDFNAIFDYIDERNKELQPNDLVMYFTTNHDENSWNYLEKEKFGLNLKNYNALTYLLGGMPLIYSGQEAGFNKQLEFFQRDPIEWGDYEYQAYFKDLISVYKNNPALWITGERATYEILKAENQSLHFIIKKNDELIAVLQNYSNHPQYVSDLALNGMDLTLNLIDSQPTEVSEKGVEVPAHSTLIIGQNR